MPPEYDGRSDEYVELVCGEMLDACRSYARWIDVFARGRFNADQSRAVLEAGGTRSRPARARQSARLQPGVRLAVELGASVDHRTYLSDDDLTALAASDTVATFLPATDFSTREPYLDARRAIDAGVQVAIATTNPGSSYTTSMALHRVAVRDMRMTSEEALLAATRGGAWPRCVTTSAGSPRAHARTR